MTSISDYGKFLNVFRQLSPQLRADMVLRYGTKIEPHEAGEIVRQTVADDWSTFHGLSAVNSTEQRDLELLLGLPAAFMGVRARELVQAALDTVMGRAPLKATTNDSGLRLDHNATGAVVLYNPATGAPNAGQSSTTWSELTIEVQPKDRRFSTGTAIVLHAGQQPMHIAHQAARYLVQNGLNLAYVREPASEYKAAMLAVEGQVHVGERVFLRGRVVETQSGPVLKLNQALDIDGHTVNELNLKAGRSFLPIQNTFHGLIRSDATGTAYVLADVSGLGIEPTFDGKDFISEDGRVLEPLNGLGGEVYIYDAERGRLHSSLFTKNANGEPVDFVALGSTADFLAAKPGETFPVQFISGALRDKYGSALIRLSPEATASHPDAITSALYLDTSSALVYRVQEGGIMGIRRIEGVFDLRH